MSVQYSILSDVMQWWYNFLFDTVYVQYVQCFRKKNPPRRIRSVDLGILCVILYSPSLYQLSYQRCTIFSAEIYLRTHFYSFVNMVVLKRTGFFFLYSCSHRQPHHR